MRIQESIESEHHIHFRTLLIEDGPVIDGGPSYASGLKFKVEKISIKWNHGEAPTEVRVAGHREKKDGTFGTLVHDRKYFSWQEIPDWLAQLLAEAEIKLKEHS